MQSDHLLESPHQISLRLLVVVTETQQQHPVFVQLGSHILIEKYFGEDEWRLGLDIETLGLA
jgi:hypothetical protein